MSKNKEYLNPKASWKDLTPGGIVYDAGNSNDFNTGDWRSEKPVYIKENCKQCLLCFPVCPDSSIPVNSEGKREDFDFNHCKGCGVCAAVCPFNAIKMVDNND